MNNFSQINNHPPTLFRRMDQALRTTIMWITCALLALMVVFTVYTVVMRYVFQDPPFWGDTVSMFCNIWLVLIAYALSVRDREDIASEGIYEYLPPRVTSILIYAWQILTLVFGAFLFWYGLEAALDVPGQYWELGGLSKTIPMMVLPISGALITVMSAITVIEEACGLRSASEVVEEADEKPGAAVLPGV